MCINFNAPFQPPPLIEYFPVLHYVVSYNTTVIQTQLSSSISSYTVSSEPGVTYYITVRAVNAVGPGAVNGYSIVNGEINKIIFQCHNHRCNTSLNCSDYSCGIDEPCYLYNRLANHIVFSSCHNLTVIIIHNNTNG